ncbi:MAG: hypothetical protein VCC00_09215, partial [Deltaproteobacteria bacterium]
MTFPTSETPIRDLVAIFSLSFLVALPATSGAAWNFTDVTATAGVSYVHGFAGAMDMHDPRALGGGVAVGDFDADGWPDIYAVAGSAGANHLF